MMHLHALPVGAIVLAIILTLGSCAPKDGIRTIRTTTDTEADLGTINEIDGPVTVRLVVRNDYADTLFPVHVHAPCGCTSGQLDTTPVPPGGDETIEVTYNPAYRPGPMMEQIQIYYRNSPVKMRILTIKGKVKGFKHPIEEDRPYNFGEGLYMSHMVLAFGSIPDGTSADMFFRYGNGLKKAAKLTFDIPQEWRPYFDLRSPGRLKADFRDTLHVSMRMPEGIDTAEFKVQPLMDGKPTEQYITVKAVRRK